VRFSTHFFTPINPIWVGDLRTGEFFLYFSKTTADIRHFVFFAHAEPALKKRPTQAESAQKNAYAPRLSLR
jgi:hypothetical protein